MIFLLKGFKHFVYLTDRDFVFVVRGSLRSSGPLRQVCVRSSDTWPTRAVSHRRLFNFSRFRLRTFLDSNFLKSGLTFKSPAVVEVREAVDVLELLFCKRGDSAKVLILEIPLDS